MILRIYPLQTTICSVYLDIAAETLLNFFPTAAFRGVSQFPQASTRLVISREAPRVNFPSSIRLHAYPS